MTAIDNGPAVRGHLSARYATGVSSVQRKLQNQIGIDTVTDLPKPDQFGNYWLNGKAGATIFVSAEDIRKNRKPPRYFVSTGGHKKFHPVLTEADGSLRYFDTAEQALKVLEAMGAI